MVFEAHMITSVGLFNVLVLKLQGCDDLLDEVDRLLVGQAIADVQHAQPQAEAERGGLRPAPVDRADEPVVRRYWPDTSGSHE
jgi:hypothetical protein